MCKFALKQLLLTFAFALLLAHIVPIDTAEKPCAKSFDCSYVESVIWATDAKAEKCYVWRNICHFMNENCQRLNRFEKELIKISKAECQKICSKTVCTTDYSPVCAEYNGLPRNFSNSCALEGHICRTGETYNLHNQGVCQEAFKFT